VKLVHRIIKKAIRGSVPPALPSKFKGSRLGKCCPENKGRAYLEKIVLKSTKPFPQTKFHHHSLFWAKGGYITKIRGMYFEYLNFFLPLLSTAMAAKISYLYYLFGGIFGPVCNSASFQPARARQTSKRVCGISHIILYLLSKVLDGKYPTEILGNGSQGRTFPYLEEAVKRLIKAMTERRYGNSNIRNPGAASARELVNTFGNPPREGGSYEQGINNWHYRTRWSLSF